MRLPQWHQSCDKSRRQAILQSSENSPKLTKVLPTVGILETPTEDCTLPPSNPTRGKKGESVRRRLCEKSHEARVAVGREAGCDLFFAFEQGRRGCSARPLVALQSPRKVSEERSPASCCKPSPQAPSRYWLRVIPEARTACYRRPAP